MKRYFRGELNTYIKAHGIRKGIQIDVVNGMQDHIHVLFKMPILQNTSEVIKLIKGSSSKWINDQYFPSGKFRWQQGYGVFSVGKNEIQRVRNYIYNQEEHHKYRSYQEEVKLFEKEEI